MEGNAPLAAREFQNAKPEEDSLCLARGIDNNTVAEVGQYVERCLSIIVLCKHRLGGAELIVQCTQSIDMPTPRGVVRWCSSIIVLCKHRRGSAELVQSTEAAFVAVPSGDVSGRVAPGVCCGERGGITELV